MELIWPHPITPMLVLLVVSKGTILFLYKSSERDGPCDRSGWLTDIIEPSTGKPPLSKQGMRVPFLVWGRGWESLPL